LLLLSKKAQTLEHLPRLLTGRVQPLAKLAVLALELGDPLGGLHPVGSHALGERSHAGLGGERPVSEGGQLLPEVPH
jgi:hypothetical protein